MHALFAQPCLNVCKTSLLLLKVKGSIDNSPISAVVHDLSKVLGTFYKKTGIFGSLNFLIHLSTAGPSHIRIVHCRLDAGIPMGDRGDALVN